MSEKKREFPDDRTAAERRKGLSKEELKELQLAGGVEGGMKAGSGGGPSERDALADDAPDNGDHAG
jgi:hypothetical protein